MQLNIFRGLRPRAPAAVASEPAFRADSFKNPAHAPVYNIAAVVLQATMESIL